jgi:hypothetical protein
MVFIGIFMIHDVEHLFMCVLIIYISLETYLDSFPIFFGWGEQYWGLNLGPCAFYTGTP